MSRKDSGVGQHDGRPASRSVLVAVLLGMLMAYSLVVLSSGGTWVEAMAMSGLLGGVAVWLTRRAFEVRTGGGWRVLGRVLRAAAEGPEGVETDRTSGVPDSVR